MNRIFIIFVLLMSLAVSQPAKAQDMSKPDSSSVVIPDSAAQDSLVTTMVDDEALAVATGEEEEEGGFHKQLKTKFIDGNVGFMSLVALPWCWDWPSALSAFSI